MSEELIFKICVGDLAAYNNGFLIYEWFDLTKISYKELCEGVRQVLRKGYVAINKEDGYNEEWHIQDVSSNINIKVGEYSNLDKLYELVEIIQDVDFDKLSKVMEFQGYDIEDLLEYEDADELQSHLDDFYFYEANTLEDFGIEMFSQLYGEPEECVDKMNKSNRWDNNIVSLLARHFDYESYARDFVASGDYSKITDGYISYNG